MNSVRPSLLFKISTSREQVTCNPSSKHRWSVNLTCLFQRAETQVRTNRNAVSCPQRLRFSPGESILPTNHNTRYYFRHSINITTNQKLSPTFREIRTRLKMAIHRRLFSRFFSEGGGRLYTGYNSDSSKIFHLPS